jgi:prepilin-type N-terminal cleavage/methylation domain-containing protein
MNTFRHNLIPGRTSGGFTLIEMLTVIGIIALLVSIVVVGGVGWINSAKERQTRVTLDTLDTLVEEYHTQMHRYFRESPIVTQGSGTNRLDFTNRDYWERMSLFLEEAEAAGEIFKLTGSLQNPTWEDHNPSDNLPPIRQVYDGWDQPIQIVFRGDDKSQDPPANPQEFRPWFVSAGEDGDFGQPIPNRVGTPAEDNLFSAGAPAERYFIPQTDFKKP